MNDGILVFAFPVSLLGGWKGGLHQAAAVMGTGSALQAC